MFKSIKQEFSQLVNDIKNEKCGKSYSCFKRYRRGRPSYLKRLAVVVAYAAGLCLVSAMGYFLNEGEFPSWLQLLVSDDSEIQIRIALPILICILIVIGLLMIAYTAWVRWRHRAAYALLDEFVYSCTHQLNQEVLSSFQSVCSAMCSQVVEVFSKELPFKKIGCAVRMRSHGKYRTLGRAGGLSQRRAWTSYGLEVDGPVANLLSDGENKSYAVFICNNTAEARALGQLDDDENGRDPIYSKEDRSIMMARLVAPDDKGESLAGMIYLTSGRNNAFKPWHVDLFLLITEVVNFAIIRELRTGETSDEGRESDVEDN